MAQNYVAAVANVGGLGLLRASDWIAQAWKSLVKRAGFRGSVQRLASGYEIVMGLLLFTSVAFLECFNPMSSSSKVWKYDVFLSFRGEDTRKNIVSHLYSALEQRGIHAFKDDERLETGKSISVELLKAIEESRFAVVIFSKRYASSKWCLEELAHIIKCRNELDQIVLPIFYDVSPSVVRHQNPPFAKSFSKHEETYKDDKEKVQRWRDAFAEAGKLSGHDLKNYKDEVECINKVVDYILPKSLQVIPLSSGSLVGMEPQIGKIISLLDTESNDVRSIGLWGMSGIGKTEIASVIYERYRHQFEADCFLGDVGEMYLKKGLTWLQQALIHKLLGKNIPITSEREGAIIIKNGLRWKKVLVILDDVNHLSQLELIVGGTEWFGRGSRILITTRDKHVIIAHVKEDKVYEVQLLSENDALELFYMHAFNRNSPERDFEELSREVVKYADGLPLALKVLGPSFCGRNKEQWRDIIDRLKKIPNDDILGKLKIGLDGLNKDEMRIFLDIACLYNYKSMDHVALILKSCGIHQSIGISRLSEKSLLSFSRYDHTFRMHSLIRQMGENMLREEYANSRIWLHEEVNDLFAGKLKTKKVESLWIPKGFDFEDDRVNHSKVFKRMKSLQVLILGETVWSDFLFLVMAETICSRSIITCLPSSLRWIEWPNYPSRLLPERFEPSHLVGLCLKGSRLVELWPISKRLSYLKHLDLSKSLELRKTPNFGDMPNLERLILEGCKNLEEVHPSLGHCRMLASLNLRGCSKLKKLPKFVSMESLENLNLRECTSLRKFPKIYGNMRRLSELYVESPWIRSLPLMSLSGLSRLHLYYCEDLESIPDTIIQNLRYLDISGCNKLAALPNSLSESQQLEQLSIYHCSRLVELPISLRVQRKLVRLALDRCENLKKLPNSIQMKSLGYLGIYNCPRLDTFPEINGDMRCLKHLTVNSTEIRELPSSIGSLSGLNTVNLEGCEDLVSLPNSLRNLTNLQKLILCGCKKLENLPENISDLQQLRLLDARGTAISQPPPSISKLGKLRSLRFSRVVQLQHSSSFVLRQLSALSSLTYLYLSNLNILGGLSEDLGSLHFLEYLNGLTELPGELPPNLRVLCADYHLALKSIRDLVLKCVNLEEISISWCGHEITECRTVTSNQVNVFKFLHHFLRRSIQNDFFRQRWIRFSISFPQGKIPEFFTYQFINQNTISVNLNPSWYTDKFMGFSICYQVHGEEKDSKVTPTLVCRLFGLETLLGSEDPLCLYDSPNDNTAPGMLFIYIPFQIFGDHFKPLGTKAKNPNDYCLFEVSVMSGKEGCWGIRLEYENKVRRWRRKECVTQSPKLHPVLQKDNAMTTEIGCSMVFKQQEYTSCTSSSQVFVENNIATERGLHLYYENKDLEVDQAATHKSRKHLSNQIFSTKKM
ncbi:tmv resistance protein n [Nicotiana attenuata]|uniref:ADP-ribosyl cyclase/cyclic ADP-ribose hydrolase n=1 Tax=Nicotiana attenuata TaxID=49451 RepID=A0A1J6HYP3_NICAT|nr:tmv resistance protein n [Nicotiana attenuata]